jgi:uncharacterized membrane-anchored protein YjiN (DUF445 family)
MLVAMAAIFVLTRIVPAPGFWTQLVRSAAEAGMVGGLADWFAITALFRHPLGLPIPHTAIIPNNKDRIGRAIGNFIERNFLTEDVLLPKLRKLQVGARFAAWLSAPSTAPLIAQSITAMLPYVLHSLRSPDLTEFLQRIFSEQVRHADFAPMIRRGLRVLTASEEANVLFERVSELARGWLERNRNQIDRLVAARSRWWIPKAIDRRIAAAIINGIMEMLTGLSHPDSDVSTKFREALASTIDEMVEAPEQRERLNEGMRRLLAHPDAQAWVKSIWNEICEAALDDLARPSSRVRQALERPISIVAEALGNDVAMQRQIDAIVEKLAHALIAWRSEIGSFFAEVVRNWDTRTLSDRLELVVGSDLQYIRMNGTIVGACVGCLIFTVSWLFD